MAVHLNRPPHSVRLVAWGRAPDGWHACVTWNQRVSTAAGVDEIGFAAWVPASAVSKPGWSSSVEVPRILLSPDRRAWPAPPGWPAWYAGVWEEGPLRAPPGVQVVTAQRGDGGEHAGGAINEAAAGRGCPQQNMSQDCGSSRHGVCRAPEPS